MHLVPVLFLLGMIFLAGNSNAGVENDKKYSAKAIPQVLIYADPIAQDGTRDGSETNYAIIVDKQRQKISLYEFDGTWNAVGGWPCSTGKQAGPKTREGDQKTPDGVYFAVRDVGHQYLSETYGARALPLDYPNWMDRRLRRSGSAIWMHGTNKPLQPWDSNGCIVLENTHIDELAGHIGLNLTPIIIVEHTRLWPVSDSRQQARLILSAVNQWHQAMMFGSYEAFSRWYAPESKPSMKWWQSWCYERNKANSDTNFKSRMSRRTIYRAGDHIVMLFDHYLVSEDRKIWAGRRKIYLRTKGGDVTIIGDTFQTSPSTVKDPLFYAWQKIWHKTDQGCNMAVNEKDDKTHGFSKAVRHMAQLFGEQ